jgi:hypothetical protein
MESTKQNGKNEFKHLNDYKNIIKISIKKIKTIALG